MKYNNIIIIAAVILIFAACKNDDEISKPEISGFELGYENSKTAYKGSDLHMEAGIVAEGRINTIAVTIHPEGEHLKSNEEWEVDTVYSKFNGLKNTIFHEHIDVPATADTGTYHFHFKVTDQDGNQKELEDDLIVKNPDDSEPPVINVSSAPSVGQVFGLDETIEISGTVTDNIALGGIYIGLVRVNQNLPDEQVNAMNTITMLHTHDFDDPAVYDFYAVIKAGALFDNNVPPKEISGEIAWQSGQYYIVVKSPDAFGGGVSFSTHYLINIQL